MLRRCFIADLRRGWWMYLIVIALLTLVGVMGVSIFTNFSIDDDFDYYKAEKYQTIYTGSIPKEVFFQLQDQGKIIGQSYNFGAGKFVSHVIDYGIAQAFDSPPLLAGKWFDCTGTQAIMPRSLANEYPIGSTFQSVFFGADGQTVTDTVTVVGHFEYDGIFSIDSSSTGPFFDGINKNRVTICRERQGLVDYGFNEDTAQGVFRLTEDEVAVLQNKYPDTARLKSASAQYDGYLRTHAPQIAASVYMYYTLFAGSAIVIITTSVSNGEYRKRRMATNMLCGANTRNLVWTEWIRTAICIVVAISLTIWLTFNLQSSEMMRTNPANLWKGALILIGVGMLIALINCVRIIRTKMLDVIGGK